MDNQPQDLLYNVGQEVIGYLPSLLAGLLLVAVGWFLGWFLKRVVIQLLVVFRLERFLQRTRWGSGLTSGDVRYALYNFIGNIVFAIILVIFLINALTVMNLTVLSHVLEAGIAFLPKMITALVIFLAGWLIAAWVDGTIRRALIKEDVPRATLAARFAKAVLMLFFSAMALTQLDVAREIVVIGFSTVIVTMGVVTVVFVARGGKGLVNRVLESIEEREEAEPPARSPKTVRKRG